MFGQTIVGLSLKKISSILLSIGRFRTKYCPKHRPRNIMENQPFLHPDSREDTEEVHEPRHRSFRKNLQPGHLVHFLIFATYTFGYIVLLLIHFRPSVTPFATSLYCKRQLQISSCLRTYIYSAIDRLRLEFVGKPYDDFEQSPWSGKPSAALDGAWHRLLEPTTIKVTEEELLRSNQSSIEFPNGGYMAWLGVFHELHCIKMLRQWIYKDHYQPNITSDAFGEWSIHAGTRLLQNAIVDTDSIDHCLDILRSAAMCHGDTTLTTFGWTDMKEKPMLNTRPIDHKCVNWEGLIGSIQSRVTTKDEMESLQNPYFSH